MSVSDLNKRKVRQFFDEVLNEGRLDLIDELVARDFVGRLGGMAVDLNGPEDVRRFVSDRRGACPELYVKVEDQIAEDDRVATRWQATIWVPQPGAGAARLGPSAGCAGITIIRLLAGKQVDAHTQCAAPQAAALGLVAASAR
jgi:hypothetical protein